MVIPCVAHACSAGGGPPVLREGSVHGLASRVAGRAPGAAWEHRRTSQGRLAEDTFHGVGEEVWVGWAGRGVCPRMRTRGSAMWEREVCVPDAKRGCV